MISLRNRVVKSSQDVNFNGVVKIDNNLICNSHIMAVNNQKISIEDVLGQSEKSLKEKQSELDFYYKKKLFEIENTRDEIVNLAKGKAESILRIAECEAQKIKTEAYNLGLEQGRAQGLSELANAIDSFKKITAKVNEHKNELFIIHEKEIYELIYFIVEKIITTKIKEDKEVIFNIINKASREFRNSDQIKVSLASCDISAEVTGNSEFLNKICTGIPNIEIELLKDAESGTIIIDNGSEIIDASAKTQLDFIKDVLNVGKQDKGK